jgi:hypothetical protein
MITDDVTTRAHSFDPQWHVLLHLGVIQGTYLWLCKIVFAIAILPFTFFHRISAQRFLSLTSALAAVSADEQREEQLIPVDFPQLYLVGLAIVEYVLLCDDAASGGGLRGYEVYVYLAGVL